jgi:hypothetical protein
MAQAENWIVVEAGMDLHASKEAALSAATQLVHKNAHEEGFRPGRVLFVARVVLRVHPALSSDVKEV